MLTLLAFELPAFLLGLLFGSFLNVCISRLPEHKSVAKPRSHCPKCLAPIRWYDNVPLLSWVLLAAKCRHCKGAIPWRYPAVELATGLWFAWVIYPLASQIAGVSQPVSNSGIGAVAAGFSATTVLGMVGILILGFLLIGLLVMDWQTHTLPDAFTWPGIAIGFFIECVQAVFLPRGMYDIHWNPRNQFRLSGPGSFQGQGDVFLTGPEHIVYGRLLAICIAAAIPWLIRALYKKLRKREGLGMGDVKLMAMIAAFLGFAPAMLALFIGVLLGAPKSNCDIAASARHVSVHRGIHCGCAGGADAGVVSRPVLIAAAGS